MFLWKLGQKARIEKGQMPAETCRFLEKNNIGIAYGPVHHQKDIPKAYKVGIFAGKSYECAVRFFQKGRHLSYC